MKPSEYINGAALPDDRGLVHFDTDTLSAMLDRVIDVLDALDSRVKALEPFADGVASKKNDDDQVVPGCYAANVFASGRCPNTNFDPKPDVAKLVQGGFLQTPEHEPIESVTVNQGDGLPPLCDRSRFDGDKVTDVSGDDCWTGSWSLFIRGGKRNAEEFDIRDVRHLLARHDRANGCYFADHFRVLASDLLKEADDIESRWPELRKRFPPALPSFEEMSVVREKRDAAKSILAILDELAYKGVCG